MGWTNGTDNHRLVVSNRFGLIHRGMGCRFPSGRSGILLAICGPCIGNDPVEANFKRKLHTLMSFFGDADAGYWNSCTAIPPRLDRRQNRNLGGCPQNFHNCRPTRAAKNGLFWDAATATFKCRNLRAVQVS
ncbi:Os04g0667066 [Oryza sativa Japonica Group]|uniref:Os04g0667066 protein n=1 Tax=Oryza sativa subsp. japonica TaxID=39947 RepID=A0A0P0WG43_ORYSJ|nr:Os04g0667066 [Oryza sativa Japonica Group]